MPEEIVIWEDAEWKLLSFDEVVKVTDEDILIYKPGDRSHVSCCSHFDYDSVELKYKEKSGGCYLLPSMWRSGSWFLPYRRIGSADVTKCRCNGPAANKFCFDTQKVELVCYRCHKRKRG